MVQAKQDKKQPARNALSNKTGKEKFIRAVGRRKTAVARVRLFPKGKGKIEINGKDYKKYFPDLDLYSKVVKPLEVVGKQKDFDFSIKIVGGGKLGQAEACRHGIARALINFNKEDYRATLKAEGLLTRDPRQKERKKPGLKKARRAPQFSKR